MPELSEPIIVVSDIHLHGGRRCERKFERLRGLWAQAATVIFNGDTLTGAVSRDPQRRRRVTSRLSDLCRQDGAEAVFIAGNSDRHIQAARHIFVAGERVLILHGDVVFSESSPWRPEAKKLSAARAQALGRMPRRRRETLEGQLSASHEAMLEVDLDEDRRCGTRAAALLWRLDAVARRLIRPGLILAVLRAWRTMPALAAQFIRQYAPTAGILIVGHTHHAGVWLIEGKTIINTGSPYGPGPMRVVQIEGNEVRFRAVVKSKGRYVPGRTIRRLRIGEVQNSAQAGP